ncbi:MAG: hypothetical protein GY803_12080 [Chloroflexi bacterium]|nr:hypothetical protein [Chloroflexota bacterium]
MHTFPLYKRLYYRFLGIVYGFTYWTNRHNFLGLRVRTLVWLAAFVPLIMVWRQNRGSLILWLALAFGLWVLWLYWRARRVGYMRFVADETIAAMAITDALNPLPSNQKVALKASGIFGVSDREEQILLRPAEYWRVPLGDHTIMAQPEPGRFLYQFFSAATLQNLQRGWLIHGLTPHDVLAVAFLSPWGDEPLSLRALYQDGDDAAPKPKRRTVYLRFDNAGDERAVWRTIVQDARELRR